MGLFGKKWKVVIKEEGRSGTIVYTESGNEARFYWEFGGGDTLVFISGAKQADWDVKYPWAAGRCQEIYERVADEVIKQKASGHKPSFNLASGFINIQ